MNCSQENEKTSTPDEIILWLNGYPPNYSFKYPLYTISSSTTLNSLKHKITEYLLSSKHLGKNTHELKKIINLLVDTGSTIMWIPNIISNDTHKIKNHYDPNNSSSCIKLNEKFEEIYGSGY